MNSYRKLVDNSIIFGIGNLGSKIISLILIPVYTHYLSTSEYGVVDLIMTTVTMLLPIVSASVFEGLLRFTMDKDKTPDVILSNAIIIGSLGSVIAFAFYPLLNFFNFLGQNLTYFYLILLLQIFENIFSQYTRAIGKTKVFAAKGILLTFATGILNVFFLVFLKMGVQGYLLSTIIAYIISILYLVSSTKIHRDIKITKYSKTVSKDLLYYSIPMIPNSLMWWLVNASSRYFIFFFVGVNANGLFAVASKIPSLINIVNQVFTQAWQMSAIEENENKNKSKFYINVFGYLSSLMFLGTSAVLVIMKLLFKYFISPEYYLAWKAVPFLLLGAVFSSFSAFFGANYIATKQTKQIFRTSVYGGIISLLLNIAFIPLLGTLGASLSSMVSFFVMFLIRYIDTKSSINMRINWKSFAINLLIIFIQIFVLLFHFSIIGELIIEVILFICLIFFNRNLFYLLQYLINSIRKN